MRLFLGRLPNSETGCNASVHGCSFGQLAGPFKRILPNQALMTQCLFSVQNDNICGNVPKSTAAARIGLSGKGVSFFFRRRCPQRAMQRRVYNAVREYPANIDSMVEVAHQVADAAGEITTKYFRTRFQVDTKSDSSPVTIADRQAERAMREVIRATFPNHCIFGEEEGYQGEEDGQYLWVLDPIDGTKSFVTGMGFSLLTASINAS